MNRYNEEALKTDFQANCGRAYQQCSISVLDTIADPDITFNEEGVSNYLDVYKRHEKAMLERRAKNSFESLIAKIKQDGKGKKYDCLLGISGGVDSTYLAYIAREAGLRVLCLHFDNGWNSELATHNIENIVKRCNFDLQTYVIDWNEFKDIQRSYFKADVIDIEAVTDIAIFSVLDKLCSKFGIKHIIDGRNTVTECILPPSWISKNTSNLKGIHLKYGTIPLKSYPLLSPIRKRIVARTKPFVSWPILDYVDYVKDEAKALIIKELYWRDYGGKHYESVFTRFYQGFILPNNFHVDKRKAHLSNLIFSGQITKEKALEELEQPMYNGDQLNQDYDFVIKKLGFTKEEFEEYIQRPAKAHAQYGNDLSILNEFKLNAKIKRLK